MNSRSICPGLFLSCFLLLFINACRTGEEKRILYINSYHEGYPSSDDIQKGIFSVLEQMNVRLECVYLDSKRHPEEESIRQKVEEILDFMEDFKPDLVIASDDNAVLHVVKPHLDRSEIPVVFCGINWSAEKYSLGANVTGMLEVYPLRESLQIILDLNPEARRLAILSENTQSEKNNTELLDTLYRNMGFIPEYRMVDSFSHWKEAFRELSEKADLIYLPTNGAIRKWDHDEAVAYTREHIRKPVFSCDDFMMDYCVFGLTKVAREQGEWAAATAMRILDAECTASDFPYARCSRWQAYLNTDLAGRIGFDPNIQGVHAFSPTVSE